MNLFFHQLLARFKKSGRSRASAPAIRRFQPTAENLETREVLSTLFLVPNSVPVDATHFHSFQSAYQAAQTGDIIQVQPGAPAVASVGSGVVGDRISGGAINTSTMTIDNSTIGAGEWVEIEGGGGGSGGTEEMLVSAAHSNSPGDVTLTFNAPLYFDHTGSGATVTTLGQLGIDKAITLQGDPKVYYPYTVSSEMILPPGTANVVFNDLSFTNPNSLYVYQDHQSITVENCNLSTLTMLSGQGDANDLITNNMITGSALINGDSGGITADQVTDNYFSGNGQLYMQFNGDSVVSGNTFNGRPAKNAPFSNTAAMIFNCNDIVVYNNSFDFKNPAENSTDLFVLSDPTQPQRVLAYVDDNTFNTSGTGIGLFIDGQVEAMVQYNDFRYNAVGVYLQGDGNTVGTVDLGGGSFGSQGLNNFSTFTEAGIAKGHFAISLHNTSASEQVYAGYNIWSSTNDNLVKDGTFNTNAKEAVNGGGTTGTGYIITVIITFSTPQPAFTPVLLLPSSVDELQQAPNPALTIPPWALDAVLADPDMYSTLYFQDATATAPPPSLS